MGTVSTFTFSSDTETVTRTKLNNLVANLLTEFNGSIDNDNISASAAIAGTKINLAGSTVDQNSNAVALTVDSEATTANCILIQGDTFTTGNIIDISNCDALTTGAILDLTSNSSDTGTRDLLAIHNNHVDSTGVTVVGLTQDSTGPGVDINCTGNGPHLRLIGDPTVASPTDGDVWYDGSDLFFRNGTVSTTLGRIIQQVNTQDGAVATGTTIMPADDTIPQITEGDEYMTLAITPTNTSNKLKIEVVVHIANTADNNLTAALFQDATANALACGRQHAPAVDSLCSMVFTHYMDAGTTSATTFRVRAGSAGAGTTTFNGRVGGRLYGGVIASSITITEIKV